MKARYATILLVLLGSGAALFGQEVEEKYVEIYNLIQKADALNESGQKGEAVRNYVLADGSLKTLQSSYPLWNEKVVAYRLGYISSKLAALGPVTNAPSSAVLAATDAANTNRVRELQEELQRLQGQNALLEAKLKEALSVQPAATDPRLLARAEERINLVEKERDLLRVTLEQEKSRPSRPADPAILVQEQQILADLQQRLAQQVETSEALRRQNETLRNQLAQGTMPPSNTPPGANSELSLQLANATIAALQSTNIALRTERILLEQRLLDLAKETSSNNSNSRESSSVKKLRQERDEYKRRLDLALVELARYGSNASRTSLVGSELEVARARLSAYEAQQVPYTSEELTFFKRSDLKVELHDTAPAVRKPHELPAGAGPLMAEAQKAIEGGRFPDAERLLLQVLRQDERNVYVLANLASVQMEQKKLADAERTLVRALGADPKDPASLFLMGRLKYEQEKYDDALNALSMSAKIIPDEARTQYYLGKTLVQKGNRGPAEAALRRAVQLKPGWGEAHYSLAVVYATQEPPFIELAQWHYQKALQGGYARDEELEKWIGNKKVSAAP